MEQEVKPIPYGIGDFERLQEDHSYYVDKTPFIPLVEKVGKYLFLIRPRRMGKTLFLSVLQSYYDISRKDRFAEIFRDTYILENPTKERHSYFILYFNFSMVNPDPHEVEASFETYIQIMLNSFFDLYRPWFGDDFPKQLKELPKSADKLKQLFAHLAVHDLPKIYLIIDEYDNFTNTILSRSGSDAYEEITRGEGFFRYFFNLFKGGTSASSSGLARMFMTGVSPVTLDDVTSGMNIGQNISLQKTFNELLGFTQEDTEAMLDYYLEAKHFNVNRKKALAIMEEWYNHYSFSTKATTSIYNTDMVLYFMKQCEIEGSMPRELIDHNVRINYGKLRHLININKQLNGNFDRIQQIIETGGKSANINVSFPYTALTEEDNFISLLYYFGLLTFDQFQEGKPYLRIPNQTVWRLMYSYIREALADVKTFKLGVYQWDDFVHKMAYRGEWKEALSFLAQQIEEQTKIRDYLSGEKVVQAMFLAYLNMADYFQTHSEYELKKGYADIFLEPFLYKYPGMKFSYLIELKYITRDQFSKAKLKATIKEAETQLRSYQSDSRLKKAIGKTTLIPLVMIFNGWELRYFDTIHD